MASEIILIVGMRGFGKTTLAKYLTQEHPRVCYFDVLGEYDKGDMVRTIGDFGDYLKSYRASPSFRVRYFPSEKDVVGTFSFACEFVYHTGDCVFVIEEIGRFVTPLSYSASFDRLIRLSRHKNISIVGVTQRASDIPRIFRSQVTRTFTFRQFEPNDIKYLSRFLDSKYVEDIRKLDKLHYLESTSNGEIRFGKINLPK